MSITELNQKLNSHALDLCKINREVKSKKVTTEFSQQLYCLYERLLMYVGDGQSSNASTIFNTLEYGGYFVDYNTLKRTETINEIIS